MTPAPQARNLLHGVTLEAMVTELVAYFGWDDLGERIQIRSFNLEPSIPSSLKFLRKTPWARDKVEGLYLFMQREKARTAPRKIAMTTPPDHPTTAPFGSWASPVSAALIAGATIRLGQIALHGSTVAWSEGRPQEQGRNVVVQRSADGGLRDLNPAPFDVRTRAHEYGGGAFLLHGSELLFSHDGDQKMYRIGEAGETTEAGEPVALTTSANMRYADAVVDSARERVIAVREDHSHGSIDAVATLVAISLRDGAEQVGTERVGTEHVCTEQVLASGHDFFSTPRLRPDGQQLAWLAWDHPNMPWDGSTLWLADVAGDGSLVDARVVAGGPSESIFQPEWSPGGVLHFASDRTGWWNLYRLSGVGAEASGEPLCPMEAEFGQAQWAFGMSCYGFDGRGNIVCAFTQAGRSQLARIDAGTLQLHLIATPFCTITDLKVGADFAAFIGGSEAAPSAVVRIDLLTQRCEVLRSASSSEVDVAYVSRAEAITFPTEGGLQAHALFYAPVNPRFTGPPGEPPPLIVMSHGGPTSTATPAFNWSIQYWTTRGFAVVDVNYGGSTGYGRDYRARLAGQWGVVDVDDAVNAARFLAERGSVNPARSAIRGGSAGGYTTLCALTFRSFFQCGASHYGIGDLEALARDTHKFESRYLDGLIGPWPAAQARYRGRSPINFTERLSSPMILLQGLEDKAVPPAQAQAMFDAVRAKGLPVALLMFEGEQHGFRRAATIQRALEAELYFYGRIFGFTPAGSIEPVAIENL